MIIATLAKTPYQMRSPKDLQSFFVTLGMTAPEAKSAMTGIKEIMERNTKKRAGKLPVDGVEILD